jgi:cell division protein YceG involved in septum cleavage
MKAALIISVSIVLFLTICAVVGWFNRRRRKQSSTQSKRKNNYIYIGDAPSAEAIAEALAPKLEALKTPLWMKVAIAISTIATILALWK